MPTASVWGPYLWKFLHAFSKRAGKSQSKFKKDEETEAKWILHHLDRIIPCKECITHIILFKKETPIPSLVSTYDVWVWTLHESVNKKLSKPPGPPLHELDVENDISKLWKDYIKCVEDSILQNHIRKIHVVEFQRHVYMWLNYLL